MVERKITPDTELREKYDITGVVVFIRNLDGDILVVEEKIGNSDTGKKVGDYAVLCETTDPGEDWSRTVMRGLEEEIGIDEDQARNLLRLDPNNCFLGESGFVDGALARVVTIYYIGDNEAISSFVSEDGEVRLVGWRKPEEMLGYPLRIGVRKVLGECLQEGLFDEINAVNPLLPVSAENLKAAAEGHVA